MAVIDPDFRLFLEAQAKALEGVAMPPLAQIPPAFVRENYRLQRTGQDASPPADVEARDLSAGGVPARLYTPPGAAAQTPGLVYFHGGGWVIGDLETHDGHCRRLASYAGVRVLAVDYRLAPEHPFPAPYDDAMAATTWAFDHAAEIGFDPARIAVGGCSAGGNLAASVALDLRADRARSITFQLLLYPVIWLGEHPPSRKVLAAGPVLTEEAMTWFEGHLAADAHADGRRAKPGQEPDLSGAPPALVVTAGHDMLQDEGREYVARLQAAGVEAELLHYPEMVHDFFVMADVSPAVDRAARETAGLLRTALS